MHDWVLRLSCVSPAAYLFSWAAEWQPAAAEQLVTVTEHQAYLDAVGDSRHVVGAGFPGWRDFVSDHLPPGLSEDARLRPIRLRSNWPKSNWPKSNRWCLLCFFFFFFFLFSSLSFCLSFLFLFFFSFSSSSYSSFSFCSVSVFVPKTFALNPKPQTLNPTSAGPPSAGLPKIRSFFPLSRHSFHYFE